MYSFGNTLFVDIRCVHKTLKGSGGLMMKVSASQHRDRGFEPHTDHGHDSSFDLIGH